MKQKRKDYLSVSIKREAKYYTGLPRFREASLEKKAVGSEEDHRSHKHDLAHAHSECLCVIF